MVSTPRVQRACSFVQNPWFFFLEKINLLYMIWTRLIIVQQMLCRVFYNDFNDCINGAWSIGGQTISLLGVLLVNNDPIWRLAKGTKKKKNLSPTAFLCAHRPADFFISQICFSRCLQFFSFRPGRAGPENIAIRSQSPRASYSLFLSSSGARLNF